MVCVGLFCTVDRKVNRAIEYEGSYICNISSCFIVFIAVSRASSPAGAPYTVGLDHIMC